MALISIKRNIDLQPGLNAPSVFNCSQSDKGTTIMLGLMNGGNDYTVPSGVTITIRGSRSNGAVFTPVSATSSGSTVSFTLTEEMTDTAGPTLCEAVLEQGNNVLGTANFIINVEGSPMGADVPPVFTDAAWTWMLGKLTTETVPALGDDVISSIQGKVDKSQGSTNAKKFLRVNTSGNVSLASTDKTLLVADQIADAKETGDQIRALDAEIDGVATTLGGSISTLNGITTDLQSSKLNKNQGTSNSGKTMVVDSSGNIVPGDVPITIDDTLSIADAAADAKATGDAIALKANASTIAPEFSDQNTYTAGSYVYKNGVLYKFTAAHSGAWTGTDAEVVTVGKELTDLKADLSHIQQYGASVSASLKAALLQLASKVAYIDDGGSDYYQDLYDALNPPAEIKSISAVYTQSGAVYLDTDIDSLASDLVVTVLYTNQTTEVVPATDYTLSGTLAIGISTITVAYRGFATTFNVTVTYPQYAFENGVKNFGSSQYNRVLTVTNGNHIKYESDSSASGCYLDLSHVSLNTNSTKNPSKSTEWFLIPEGSEVTFEIKNINFERTASGVWNIGVRLANGDTSPLRTGDITTDADFSVTTTAETDLSFTFLFEYMRGYYTLFEADFYLYVDGVRWF